MDKKLDIVVQIEQELDDPRWKTRTHGSIGTYVDGCRGPLCRRANRERTNPTAESVKPKARVNDELLSHILEKHLEVRRTSSNAGQC